MAVEDVVARLDTKGCGASGVPSVLAAVCSVLSSCLSQKSHECSISIAVLHPKYRHDPSIDP